MKQHTIADPAGKALLASSVRQDLLDTLAASGESTARELAAELGLRVSALYYHLELLERAGLVVRGESSGTGGRAEATYSARAPKLAVDHQLDNTTGRRASQRIARALLHAAERDFAAGARHAGARMRGPNRNLYVSRVKGWLTPKQLREVNTHLEAIDRLMLGARRGPGKTLSALSVVLAPLEPRTPSRGGR